MTPFINKETHVLFVFATSHKGEEYVTETTPENLDLDESAQRMVEENGHRAVKFNLVTLEGEDVTELLAEHWLEQNPDAPSEHVNNYVHLPDFIMASETLDLPVTASDVADRLNDLANEARA